MDSLSSPSHAADETPLTPKPAAPEPPRLQFAERVHAVHSFSTTALFVLVLLYTLYFTRDICVPVMLAFTLYLLLSPVLRFLESWRLPTSLSAAVIVVGLFAGLGAGTYALSNPVGDWFGRMPLVMSEVRGKIHKMQKPVEDVRKASEQVEKIANPNSGAKPPEVVIRRATLGERLVNNATEIAVQLLLIAVLLYFLLATGEIFREKLVTILPRLSDKKKAVAITNQIQQQVSRYLATITVINICLGLAVGSALFLLGVPNALLWGVMAAFLNFIPYLGSMVGVGTVAIVCLVTFDTLYEAAIPPLTYLALTSLEGQIVTPSVLGRSLTLNPLAIFLVVVLWGWIWGIPGALLAVPMLVVFKAVCDNIDTWAPIGEFLSGRRP